MIPQLLDLANIVGAKVKEVLVALDLATFDIAREEDVNVAVLVFYDDGETKCAAFQATFDDESTLVDEVEEWVAHKRKMQRRVM